MVQLAVGVSNANPSEKNSAIPNLSHSHTSQAVKDLPSTTTSIEQTTNKFYYLPIIETTI